MAKLSKTVDKMVSQQMAMTMLTPEERAKLEAKITEIQTGAAAKAAMVSKVVEKFATESSTDWPERLKAMHTSAANGAIPQEYADAVRDTAVASAVSWKNAQTAMSSAIKVK